MDGVLQTAGFPDDRKGSVAHGDHLGQTAGLALGGHQQQVGAGINGHGQGLVVSPIEGHTAGIPAQFLLKELFVIPVAAAQHHKLAVEVHNLVKYAADQIQALVADQAADDGDNGNVGIHIQVQLFLELFLVSGLPGKILGGVISVDPRILGGIVAVHIDAVEDAMELAGIELHNALHAVGIVGVAQLLGIGGAYGGNGVAGHQGALEEVHIAVHGDGTVGKPAGSQAEEVLQSFFAITALIFNIMDSENGLDSAHLAPADTLVLQINGDQSSLPVIAVDDLRHKSHGGQQGDDRAGEEAEALTVIIVAVQSVALEVVLVVHKVPDHTVTVQTEQAAVQAAPAQGHLDMADKGHLVLPLVGHTLVKGQDHSHFISRFG